MSKLTKEQLQGMSDFGVNMLLAEMLGVLEVPPANAPTEGVGDKLFYRNLHGDYCECHPGYCDSPNDIMPLAFEHKIGLRPARSEWQAFAATADFYNDENPIRAIACCLILVLQEGK